MDSNSTLYKSKDILGTSDGQHIKQTLPVTTTRAAALVNVFGIPIASGVSMTYKIIATAVQTGGSAGTAGTSASWISISGLIKNVAGTVSLVASTVEPSVPAYNDATAAAWRITDTADNTGKQLLISITGEANKNINWLITVETQVVS